MLKRVETERKNFYDYKNFISPADLRRIKEFAGKLKAKKIVHINSASRGGGVAEILQGLIPLQSSLGIKAEWHFIQGSRKFFSITRKIHDSLQGMKVELSSEEKDFYLEVNKKIASDLKKLKPDLIVVHDPQPLAAASFCADIPAVLRMHIDMASPEPKTAKFLRQYMNNYRAVIFSRREYIPADFPKEKSFVVYPAIDPLSVKNRPLTDSRVKAILEELEINPFKPLIVQVSRFDYWKDPEGVIQAYYLAKNKIPDLQLVLIGSLEVQDDPAAPGIFKRVKKYAKGDPDLYVFNGTESMSFSSEFLINALQRAANPVLQKSIKEGFGLTVTEAMWKGRVVIGGNVGGIKLQIKNGVNGFLVNSPKQAAEKIVQIIKNPKLALMMGRRAKKSVEKKFLLPRLLKDHLRVYNNVLGS